MAIRFAQKTASLRKITGAMMIAGLAAACSSGGKSLDVAGETSDADYKDAISVYSDPAAPTDGLDPIAAAAFWGARYDKDPADSKNAVNYSASLRKIGSIEQAVNVMAKAAVRHSEDPHVHFEMGKALIEAGRAFEAVRYLEEAAGELDKNWRVISAYGVALDQIGEHELARAKYDYGLSLEPNSITLLNNKGLSYALDGNLNKAVSILRIAASSPGADARIRQNLALTLAIKGDLLEAERLARSDLPPQVADQNIDYFRSLVVQPAYWQDYAASDTVDTPFFDPAPSASPSTPVEASQAPAESDFLSAPAPALPTLKEEPKDEQEDEAGAPMALIEAAPVTNASAEAEDAAEEISEEDDMAPELKAE